MNEQYERTQAEAVLLDDERVAQPTLRIREKIAVTELTDAQGTWLGELWQTMRARGITPAGPPYLRYHMFGDVETDLEVGVPVSDKTFDEQGRIETAELPGGPAIRTWHHGPHDRLGEAYRRLQTWLERHDREPAGPAWEVYWWIDASQEPNPSTWPPPTEWRTELIQPITE
jgi:effector-binding domain-containing protein